MDKSKALTITCPRCGAEPGGGCYTRRGNRLSGIHKERVSEYGQKTGGKPLLYLNKNNIYRIVSEVRKVFDNAMLKGRENVAACFDADKLWGELTPVEIQQVLKVIPPHMLVWSNTINVTFDSARKHFYQIRMSQSRPVPAALQPGTAYKYPADAPEVDAAKQQELALARWARHIDVIQSELGDTLRTFRTLNGVVAEWSAVTWYFGQDRLENFDISPRPGKHQHFSQQLKAILAEAELIKQFK